MLGWLGCLVGRQSDVEGVWCVGGHAEQSRARVLGG